MTTPVIDLNNIQGDIFPSLPKKTETFFFFKISGDIARFKEDVGRLIPHIATGVKVQSDRSKIAEHKQSGGSGLLTVSGVNIAFSKQGLDKLDLGKDDGDKLVDDVFDKGMFADAQDLGDKGVVGQDGGYQPAWEAGFAAQDIDGVILVAGDCRSTVASAVDEVKSIFGCGHTPSIAEAFSIIGDDRPGDERGHEHFGFEDGISQPAIDGIDTSPNPGQVGIPPGIVFLGREGDNDADKNPMTRPPWALDGSFLCFRKLAQLVPEFDDFLAQNALPVSDPSLPADHGKQLLGARLVGRWKSGAPVSVSPLIDDVALAEDPARNNNFDFSNDAGKLCPFAAHIRKANPRTDIATAGQTDPTLLTNHLFPRRGIPYGPEVTDAEVTSRQTVEDRGLLFVCYQSNLANGFQFVQKSWCNNEGFIFGKPKNPGYDPIVGQNVDDTPRTMSGTAVDNVESDLNLGPFEWVVSKGGAYFFSPSIPALKEKFSTVTA